MKKIIVFSALVFAFVLSTLTITLVSAESKLSPSQKQEIMKILTIIETRKKQIKDLEKRRVDLRNGEDEQCNNIPMVIDLQKEGKDILASLVGKRLGEKMQEWDNSDKTKPITDFLNKEETEALRRITYISNELDEIYADEAEKVYESKRRAKSALSQFEGKLKKLEEKYGKAAIAAVKDESAGEKEAKRAAKVPKSGEKLSDLILKNIVYATAKQLGWHKYEDYEMHYLDPKGYGGRFNAHTIQLGGSVGRIGISFSKISGELHNTSKKFAEKCCKAQERDGYVAKVIKVGAVGGKKFDACYYYRNGSSKINNTSIHLMIDNYRLFFDSEDLYWLRTDPMEAINSLLQNFLISY